MAIRITQLEAQKHGLLRTARLEAPLRLSLPWAPSFNHYWRHVAVKGTVRVLISERGRQYRREVRTALLLAGASLGLTCPLSIHLDAYPPDRRKRDADNLLKGLLDSCQQGGLYADDAQVRHLSVTMHAPARPGRIEVILAQWPEEEGR